MNWRRVADPCGGCYWYSDPLPHGWSAAVTDWSQSTAPRQRTSYSYAAVCNYWIVSGPKEVDSFDEAKRLALLLAMKQEPASADRHCIVREESPDAA